MKKWVHAERRQCIFFVHFFFLYILIFFIPIPTGTGSTSDAHPLSVNARPIWKTFTRLCTYPIRIRLGCVYTYPDIRISGYPDLRDPDIFGASTRIGSKRFRRLHVSRYPDALYAAYSLCVGEIRKCLFFFHQVACFQILFNFSFLFLYLLAGRQGQCFVWYVQ